MSSIVINFIIEAVISALGWLVRLVRSALAPAIIEGAARGGKEAILSMTPEGKRRRQTRKGLKDLAGEGDVEGLLCAYRQLGRHPNVVDVRIEAINRLSAVDPVAAEPVLREIITGCDHAWLVLAALDRAAKHRMFGLLDCVDEAQGDHRPLVAKLAQDVYRRLAKAARKTTSAPTIHRVGA